MPAIIVHLLCTLHYLSQLSPLPPLLNHSPKINVSSSHIQGRRLRLREGKLAEVPQLVRGGQRFTLRPVSTSKAVLLHMSHGETEAQS